MGHRFLIGCIVIALGILAAASFGPQPVRARGAEGAGDTVKIKFSHKFHISEAGLECSACHPAAEKSTLNSDNLHPGHDQCQACHEEQITNTCGYCHTDPENIEPRTVPSREVIFSHAQHLAMKDITCQVCHVGIENAASAGAQHAPSMKTCTMCHNDRRATLVCEACHTNFTQFMPQDHQRASFPREHGEVTRLGEMEVSCQVCHRETFCQECHQTTGVKAFTGRRDLMSEPRPKTSPKDSPRQQVVQRVHDLNYRFTHGVDARGRLSDCSTCHDASAFCGECHRAGGNVSQGRFRPASHNVPGFTTLGRGTGGGLHAEEARRDMESCISCHDVPGQDPTCLTCHTPSGTVR